MLAPQELEKARLFREHQSYEEYRRMCPAFRRWGRSYQREGADSKNNFADAVTGKMWCVN